MSKLRARGEKIRRFILENVEQHPHNIAQVTAQEFDITRQATNKHLKRLVEEDALKVEGKTRSRVYRLSSLVEWVENYEISPDLAEDVVWSQEIKPRLGKMPDNVLDIWNYAFTEMFNNAIDHSTGKSIEMHLSMSATETDIALYDDGVGIFEKIKRELGLPNENHAVIELAKGKLTTDPDRHTGEGIFFTSRMVDSFTILSGGTCLIHRFGNQEDWILEADQEFPGTGVLMKLNNHTARSIKTVFDQFSSGDDYGFTKTVVPVKLAQYGDDKLISRSQAKRLLTRFERFKVVILDFDGVDSVGQAFADEVFRVFPNMHPDIDLTAINATTAVEQMINRARSNK